MVTDTYGKSLRTVFDLNPVQYRKSVCRILWLILVTTCFRAFLMFQYIFLANTFDFGYRQTSIHIQPIMYSFKSTPHSSRANPEPAIVCVQ